MTLSAVEILVNCSSGEIVLSLLLWLEIKSRLLFLAEGVAVSAVEAMVWKDSGLALRVLRCRASTLLEDETSRLVELRGLLGVEKDKAGEEKFIILLASFPVGSGGITDEGIADLVFLFSDLIYSSNLSFSKEKLLGVSEFSAVDK